MKYILYLLSMGTTYYWLCWPISTASEGVQFKGIYQSEKPQRQNIRRVNHDQESWSKAGIVLLVYGNNMFVVVV